MRESVRRASRHSIFLTALAVTLLFSARFLFALPFSGNTRAFNYETIATISSVFIYNNEPLSFPLGAIKGLTFPFPDANVGNVGGIPLFGVPFKILGRAVPYFRTFDYFILLEILSCLATALFSQRILQLLGVRRAPFLALGALLPATSFLILNRSAWLQPFCVISIPIFAAWVYAMLLALGRGEWKIRQDVGIVLLFPLTALSDNYTLYGLLLGTGALTLREAFEALFGGMRESRNRLLRLAVYCAGGVALSLFALFLIGMYPVPALASHFTTYDFGMGGRFHVADLFGPWIPVANQIHSFSHPSLLGRIGFPINTDLLDSGQYEGVAYIGTAALFIWLGIGLIWLLSAARNLGCARPPRALAGRLRIYSPWDKTALAAFFVFLVSLGYELHIFGTPFPLFTGMPGAWLADRFPSLYHFRAPGRLAVLLSLILVLEAVRRLALGLEKMSQGKTLAVVAALALLHLAEVAPFLNPIAAQPILPLGGVYSEGEAKTLKQLGQNRKAVLIAPDVMSSGPAGTEWSTQAFTLSYYLGIPSNLYYLARGEPDHYYAVMADIATVLSGDWDGLRRRYGDILFALPARQADAVRTKVEKKYVETRIGPMSVWSFRPPGADGKTL